MVDKLPEGTTNTTTSTESAAPQDERRSLKRPRATELEDENRVAQKSQDTAQDVETDIRPAKRCKSAQGLSDEERVEKLSPLLTFWLSPANLSKDKFLRGEMIKNKFGWIPLALFLSFRKVQALSASEANIVSALQALQLNHVEIEDAESGPTRLRINGGLSGLRKLLEKAAHDEDQRTVYIETLRGDVSREKLFALFGQFGTISYVSVPRFPDGKCKGFAFIEFQKKDGADKVVLASRNKTLSTQEYPSLRAIFRAEWRESKEEYKAKKRARRVALLNAGKKDGQPTNAGRSGTEEKGKDSETHQKEDNCGADEASNAPSAITVDESPCFEAGLIVAISGLSKATRRVSRSALYESLEEYGPLSYIDYSPKNVDDCKARFVDPSGARGAVTSLAPSGGSDVLGAIVCARVLKGDEEAEYWREIEENRKTRAFRKMHMKERQKARRVAPRKQPNREAVSSTKKAAVHSRFPDEDTRVRE